MRRSILRSSIAAVAALLIGIGAAGGAAANDTPGVPYSDQIWQFPPVFEASYRPANDIEVGQPFVVNEDAALHSITLWIFDNQSDDWPSGPILNSAVVYDVTGLEYEDFADAPEVVGGEAVIGQPQPDAEQGTKYQLSLSFPELPELSTESRYLLVLDHVMGDYSKVSYAIGIEQPSAEQPIVNTDNGYWAGYTNGRIWHEIFLVDPLLPEVPELIESDTCDVPSEVRVPEQDGLEYTVTEDGNTVSVALDIPADFIVAPEADLGPWEFDITPEPCPVDEDDDDKNDDDKNDEPGGSTDEEDDGSDKPSGNGEEGEDEPADRDGQTEPESIEGDEGSSQDMSNSELPRTGSESGAATGIALGTIGLGVALILVRRKLINL